MTTLADLNIDTAPLAKLQEVAALEEEPCPAEQELKHQYAAVRRAAERAPLIHPQSCLCNGTGSAPLLDAGLVRETCPLCGGQGLLEGPCDCEDPPKIEHHLVQCQGCNGTGSAPLLAGVREVCTKCQGSGEVHFTFYRVDCFEKHGHDLLDWQNESERVEGCRWCQGRGWVASRDTWRYVRALGQPLKLYPPYNGPTFPTTKWEACVGLVTPHGGSDEDPELATMRAIAQALVAMKGDVDA